MVDKVNLPSLVNLLVHFLIFFAFLSWLCFEDDEDDELLEEDDAELARRSFLIFLVAFLLSLYLSLSCRGVLFDWSVLKLNWLGFIDLRT